MHLGIQEHLMLLEMPSMDKEAKLLKRNAIKKKLPLFALEQRERFPEENNSSIEGFRVQNAN